MGGVTRCSNCRRGEGEPSLAGLCFVCADEEYPAIEARGSRWSPLAIGALSLVCDPFLIPTILAIKRGLGELSDVRLRERVGLWRPEHPRVRTGAVWGITLGSVRLVAFALVALTVVLAAVFEGAAPAEPTPPPFDPSFNELGEVLERLGSEDDDAASLACDQLPAVLIDTDEPSAPHRALERIAELPAGADRDRAVEAVLSGIHRIDETLDGPLLDAHDSGGPLLQQRILVHLADWDRTHALGRALLSHRNEAPPLAPLPRVRPVEVVLLRLGLGHAYRAHAVERFAEECASDAVRTDAIYARVQESIDYALLRVQTPGAGHRAQVRHAAAVLPALGCIPDDGGLAQLRRLLRHAEPRIAIAAIVTLRDRTHDSRVGERELRGALRDPHARAFWQRRGDPLSTRPQDAAAFAEAEGAHTLEGLGHECGQAQVRERLASDGRVRVEHRWQCDDGVARLTRSVTLPARVRHWTQRCGTPPTSVATETEGFDARRPWGLRDEHCAAVRAEPPVFK